MLEESPPLAFRKDIGETEKCLYIITLSIVKDPLHHSFNEISDCPLLNHKYRLIQAIMHFMVQVTRQQDQIGDIIILPVPVNVMDLHICIPGDAISLCIEFLVVCHGK